MPTTLLPDPNDPDLLTVDTTPHGADPDAPVSFDPPEFDDRLDPQAFLDEPWDDLDPEAEAEDDAHDGPLSFDDGPVALADTSTRAHWLQSALKVLVAPQLEVDGALGPRTSRAVQTFQRRSASLGGGALRADGVAGPRTVAALERLTRSTAPAEGGAARASVDDDLGDDTEVAEREAPEAGPELADPPPASAAPTVSVPAVGGAALTLHERSNADGVVEYHVRAGADEVVFSYWTPDWRNYKPYNVSRYRGARKGLISDAQIEALGYSSSELKILKANALKESNGAFGAINTWDDQIVSWGMAQFAGQAGTLAVLLAELKESPRTRASFARWFQANGVDVARGDYPWKGGKTRTGWHVVVTEDTGEVHRGNDGWHHIRTRPELIGAFMLAGNDPQIQLGQIEFWRRSFLSRAIAKRVAQRPDGTGGGAVRRYITSERGLAVLVRLHNWMPGHVVTWSNRFIGELQRAHPGTDLSDPFCWDQALEDSFVKKVCDERKRVKSGSYDTYALDLSTRRDSFKPGREVAST